MSASAQCHHPDLHLDINTVNFDDSNVKCIEIKIKCTICNVPMRFLGNIPFGVSFAQPTASLDRTELRLPIVGVDEEPNQTIGFVGGLART